MRELTPKGEHTITELARRHGFSHDAVHSMLESVANGNGTMAQFHHSEFGGSGQWMRGGMTMVSDMFNDSLKGRVQNLCSELAELIANEPPLVRSASARSQTQHSGHQGETKAGTTSLFVEPAPGISRGWWPAELGSPTSTGAQNHVRYAYFLAARRLAIETKGHLTVYDTLDHKIGGFSQQQSYGGSLSFNSQHGLIDVAKLPIVRGAAASATVAAHGPATTDKSSERKPANDTSDVLSAIEKLGDLHAKGHLSDEEFAKKKPELLSRL